MRFDVLTLFPELLEPHLRLGVTRRAFAEGGPVAVRLWPLRPFGDPPQQRVDDRPFGGGAGMVLMSGPLERALQAVLADRQTERAGPAQATAAAPWVVHFTPGGAPLTQAVVREFAAGPGAVLVCGRYEAVDQRFIDRHVTHQLSLGDFVLSGGEIPALALLDAVARLAPGVIETESHEQESFGIDGLLEGPAYTRPERLPTGEAVPPVLLSGHHAEIARWRRQQALALTLARRPDLLERLRADGRLSREDEQFLATLAPRTL